MGMKEELAKAQEANRIRTEQLNTRSDSEKAAVKLDTQKPSETVMSMGGGMDKATKDAISKQKPEDAARAAAVMETAKNKGWATKGTPNPAPINPAPPTNLKSPDTEPKNGLAALTDEIFANELIYNYTEPTYHLTWSMVPEDLVIIAPPIKGTEDETTIQDYLAKQRLEFEPNGGFYNKRIIIAESAVTADLNIQSFTMETALAVNSDARKTIPTEFTMELFEPYGCTMFDILYQTSILLGFDDWKKGPHHTLEIEFFGRNIETGRYEQCVFEKGGKSRWLWRFCITGITAKVDEGGAHYTLKGCPMGDTAQNKQVFQIPKNMDFPKGDTIGNFFKNKLKKELNDFYDQARSKQIPIPRHTFSFYFENTTVCDNALDLMNTLDIDHDFTKWMIIDNKTTANRAASQQGKGGKIGKWAEGTTFEQILQDVQCSTKEMQRVITGKKDENSVPIEDRKHILKVDFRIVSDIIPKQYDAILREYEYHYVHRIIPFVTTMHIVDEEKPKDRNLKDKKTAAHQDERYKNVGKNKMVCKKYSHIYTGENQDLLDFQIELNLMTFSQLPKMTSTYNTKDSGVIKDPAFEKKMEKIRQDAAAKNKTDSEIQKIVDNERKTFISNFYADENNRNALAGKVGNITFPDIVQKDAKGTTTTIKAPSDLGQKMIDKLKNDKEGQSVLLSLDGTPNSSNNIQRLAVLEKGLRTAALKSSGADKANFERAANNISDQINNISADQRKKISTKVREISEMNGKRNYAIELKYKGSGVGKAIKEAMEEMQRTDIIQIPTLADMETAVAAMEGNAQSPDMQKLTMAMLNQTHNTSQMIEAKITIVGDPYWLGQDNIEDIKMLKEKMEKAKHKSQPNPIASSIMFLLELKFPENYNEESGTMEFSSENLFKGLYNVVKATHKFADGKFTQELTAYRELLTNMLTQDITPEPAPNQKPAEGAGKDTTKQTRPAPTKTAKDSKDDSPERAEKRKKYVEYLMTKKGPNGENWTEEQAKGIVNNLEKESRLNPTAVEEGKLSDKRMAQGGERGEGLAQWTSRGQKDAVAEYSGYPKGTPIGQIPEEKQLDYLNYQLNTPPAKAGGYGEVNAGREIQKQTTMEGASRATTISFERPANKNAEAEQRVASMGAKYSFSTSKSG